MEEAQEDLGWGTDSFVPITYTNELSWQQVSDSFSKLSQTPDLFHDHSVDLMPSTVSRGRSHRVPCLCSVVGVETLLRKSWM